MKPCYISLNLIMSFHRFVFLLICMSSVTVKFLNFNGIEEIECFGLIE